MEKENNNSRKEFFIKSISMKELIGKRNENLSPSCKNFKISTKKFNNKQQIKKESVESQEAK